MHMVIPPFLMLNGKNAFPNITYENFLIDLLNVSSFFSEKRSFMEHFRLQEEQSAGEPDAFTSTYALDFKLLVDEDVMIARYKNLPEVDYSRMSEGFVFSKTKEKVCEIPDDKILEYIKDIDIDKIKIKEYRNRTEESIVKNIKKDKNLLLYYPYEYYGYPIGKDGFGKVLSEIFQKLFTYRDSLGLKKDTYVCIKINENFVLYEWKGSRLVFREEIHEYLCTNYMGLKTYAVC